MAETPPPVKITERLVNIDTYKKYAVYVLITLAGILLVVGGVSLWRFFFKPKEANVNKPTFIAMPWSKVEKDAVNQSNSQVMIEKEKPWEVGLGVGGIRYDNKDGYFGGGWVKRKF